MREEFEVNFAEDKDVHRQSGDLQPDVRDVARRGLPIRHLALPGHRAGIDNVPANITREPSPETNINMMGHYPPWCRTDETPSPHQALPNGVYQAVLVIAARYGLSRLDQRQRQNRSTK